MALDPQQLLKMAMSRLNAQDKTSIIKNLLEDIAQFIDHHNIIVPELSVSFGGVAVSLSAKRVDQSATAVAAPLVQPAPTINLNINQPSNVTSGGMGNPPGFFTTVVGPDGQGGISGQGGSSLSAVGGASGQGSRVSFTPPPTTTKG